ncbi:MAG: response regulator transcription factor [Bacilli bacterium]|nr:response regulator transcription factor [Bacilli bacterium]
MTILIIEDEEIIRQELAKLLEKNLYKTIQINNFSNLIEQIKELKYDLILLDINLEFESGYEICRKIKKINNIPIIFVTSRNTSEDELLSIQVGGIDFVNKPYNKSILLEKIKRALKTTNPLSYKEITKKEYTLDLHLSILKYREKEVELTRNEFRILYYFFKEDKTIIKKEELLEYLWNDKLYLDEGILLVNINRLRKKAKEIGINNLLETVRGVGYRL